MRRIEMPTPYAVGPVNAYLIDAEPATLIDCGIDTVDARNALLLGLTANGYFPQAIEHVLVTHAHPDHYGLVALIQQLSGARVHFPEKEIMRVRDQQMLFEVGRLLMAAGVPLDLLFEMDQQRRRDPHARAVDHDGVVPVRDGDTFPFSASLDGREVHFMLQAHHMPGHTGGHMVYLEPESGTLFAGDQLLPDVSPNPLLEPSVDEPGQRRRSLKEYIASLQAMATWELSVVYPGHGEPVTDPGALIARTLAHHERRKALVAARLSGEPRTPYDIARELYPHVTGYDTFLAVSEVVAHLDLVVDDGLAETIEDGGVVRYRLVRA